MPIVLLKTGPEVARVQPAQQQLWESRTEFADLLRARLGFNHAELFATARPAADGAVTWISGLVGPVTPGRSLGHLERDKLVQRVQRMLEDIRGLAGELRRSGNAPLAERLEQAATWPSDAELLDRLFSVGGKPVLVRWGHVGAAGAAAPAAATPAAGGPAVAAAEAPAGVAAPRRTSAKAWMAALVLPLLAAGVVFWSLHHFGAAGIDKDALARQIAQANERNSQLEAELAAKRSQRPSMECRATDPVPAPAPAPASAPASSAEAPPPDPLQDIKKRVAEVGNDCRRVSELLRDPRLRDKRPEAAELKRGLQARMEGQCREFAIREAKNLCPGDRPKELAPEMVVVFDASGSMQFGVDVTEEQIRQAGAAAALEGMLRQFGGIRGGSSTMDQLRREPTRITTARQAAESVVGRAPSDMAVGLVMVDECPSARSVGMFPPSARGDLLGRIRAIQPQRGTPLADGIDKAGGLVDGVRKEALIVVVSDGTESCNRDPCAVATALKRSKPYVKINVVDITGTGAGNCVAAATGGKVFTARNASEVMAMTQRAAQDALGPGSCKGR